VVSESIQEGLGANFDHAYSLDRTLLQAGAGKALSLGIQQQNSEAIGTLRALEAKINEHGVVDPEAMYKIAQAYASLRDKASALRVLRHSIDNGFFTYPYFATDSLRSEGDSQAYGRGSGSN
jgi:hypothetical protein